MGKSYVLSNGASLYAQEGSTEFKIAGSTGLLYSQGRPVFTPDSTVFNPYVAETIAAGSSQGETMKSYGVSVINAVAGANSSALTTYIQAPIIGVRKTILVNSTADLVGNLNVDLGSGVSMVRNTSDAAFRFISFSTLGTHQSLDLIGVTTAKWGFVSCFSTGGVWDAAAGIRATTAFSS
jgi:hypothetical protein